MSYVDARFALDSYTVERLHSKQPQFGFDGLGEVVYARTYSRLKADGTQESWADTVVRVVEGNMSIYKDYCQKNGVHYDETHWGCVASDMANFIFDMKFLPPGRGLWALGTDYIYQRGSAALNNCFDGSMEYLTETNGIVSFADTVGTTQRVLTEHGWADATIEHFGQQFVNRIQLTPYRTRSNVVHDVYVTQNHRWVLADGTETTKLKVGDIVRSMSANVDRTTVAYREGFQHGVVFGDGTQQSQTTHRVRLCGQKKHLASYFDDVSYPEYMNGDAMAFVRNGEALKELPSRTEPSYIAGFIEGWVATDGRKDNRIDSTNHAALDWLKKYAPYAGLIVVGDNIDKTTETNYGTRTHKVRRLAFRSIPATTTWTVKRFIPVGVRDVYCAVVPEQHRFTLSGGIYTGNCGYVDVQELSRDAAWLMDMLMCGVGVGFSTHKMNDTLFYSPSKANPVRYVIPDTREGWVESVRRLIASYESPNQRRIIFNYNKIRKAGEPIKGFGGTSSGPDPLNKLHERLRGYLNRATNKQRPEYTNTRLIADVMNAIGACVVAGNVRRSAEIATGTLNDDIFLNLKNYKMFPERQELGWMSNNSVLLEKPDDFLLLPKVADKLIHRWPSGDIMYFDVDGNATNLETGKPLTRSQGQPVVTGDPGIVNMMSARKYGRFKEKIYGEDNAVGVNPCAEQMLASHELCNLVEVFPTRCKDQNEIWYAMELATLFASIVSLLPTHSEKTNAIMQKNRRIGVSISGIADWLEDQSIAHLTHTLRVGYEQIVRPINAQFMANLGLQPSIRVTTVKPSGTLSQLVGVSPGMHWPTFRYAIRRIRLSIHSPLIPLLADAGYPLEMDTYSDNTAVVEFPIDQGKTRSAKEVSMWEQASMSAFLQREWSDNGVSCTIYFNPETEAHDLERLISMYAPQIKAMSFLGHTDNGAYAQMPYEGITRDEYLQRKKKLKPVDLATFTQSGKSDGLDTRFCETDKCEVTFPITTGA